MKGRTVRTFVWRALKVIAFLVVAGVTVLALAVAMFSFCGRSEWTKTKKELVACGELLSWAQFQRTSVADGDNFFADPLWDVVRRKHVASGGAWAGLDDLARMPSAEERQELERRFPEFSPLPEKILSADIWKQAEKGDGALRLRAAEFILAWQQPMEGTLARIDELSRRSEADSAFDPLSPTTSNPFITAMTSLAEALRLRSCAFVRLGRTDEAMASLRVLFRLYDKQDDRLIINYFVQLAVYQILYETVKTFLESNELDDLQLAHLQRQLQGVDLIGSARNALRSERAFFNTLSEALSKDDQTDALKGFGLSGNDWDTKVNRWTFRVLIHPGDQAKYNRVVQRLVDLSEEIDQRPINGLDPFLGARQLKPGEAPILQRITSFSSLQSTPLFIRLLQRAIDFEAMRRLEVIVCALERYRLEHEEFPASLDAIAPAYIERVPLDPAAAEPMHYRREAADKFTLWSVGWNGTDEGGQASDLIWRGH